VTTADRTVLRSERYFPLGSSTTLGYQFPLPEEGRYHITLLFAEICTCADQVGERVFDVFVNGLLVLPSLDLMARAGFGAGLAFEFVLTTTDTDISITFSTQPGFDSPKINGVIIRGEILDDTTTTTVGPSGGIICNNQRTQTGGLCVCSTVGCSVCIEDVFGQNDCLLCGNNLKLHQGTCLQNCPAGFTATLSNICEASSTTTTTTTITTTAPAVFEAVYRVNCGGDAFLDSADRLWLKDTFFNTGDTFASTASVANLGGYAMQLYQTERFDPLSSSPNLRYLFDVSTVDVVDADDRALVGFRVILHFAELYADAAQGQVRRFDVRLQGLDVATSINLAQSAGMLQAVRMQFDVQQAAIDDRLEVRLRWSDGADVTLGPKVAGIEIIAKYQ
jgi:hypothetical protein